jgi:leader peptidase (prepilin peptidase)/N-methyltransferase
MQGHSLLDVDRQPRYVSGLPPDVLFDLVYSPGAYALSLVLGLLLGSFANVCILRVPQGQSIVHPGSHCMSCGHAVSWYDNLPLVSYVLLRGRCRACGAAFSPRYLLVEAGFGMLVVATHFLCLELLYVGDSLPRRLARLGAYVLLELVLVVIAFIDLDHKKIPDRITYPGIPLFFALGQLLGDCTLLDGAIGMGVGYGVVRAVSDGYFYLTGREGLGYGDGKLLALVGGFLGWRAVLFTLFAGSVLGSVIGVTAIVIHRLRKPPHPDAPPLRHVELPFGPFLVAATCIYLYLQDLFRITFGLLGTG